MGAAVRFVAVMGLLIGLLLGSYPGMAHAQCVLPNQLTNGQPTDATQVMANFNALATCANPGGPTGALQYNTGSGLGGVGPLTDGQLVIGSTGNAPQAATLNAGPGITITNGPGSVTISGGTITGITAGTGLSGGGTSGNVTLTVAAPTAQTTVEQAWTAGQAETPVSLPYASTITPNFGAGNNFAVTLTGNAALANPTNITPGQAGVIVVTQDSTGGRTLTYGSYFEFSGGTAPTLSVAPGAVDLLSYYVISATQIAVSASLNFMP